jgi:meso-butanediol dehydrogenase / (S,S)-butanediol dehydrogenase / diacetyl reductase
MDLKKRVAIVTGAVGAIGHGICDVLAKVGMQVVVADMKQQACDDYAAKINATGGNAMGVAVDVTESKSILTMVEKVISAYGQIDVLVNNAGVVVIAPLIEYTEEDFDRVLRVNLKGAFLCAKAVVPHMIERKNGRIINISSIAAKRPAPLQSAYAASKYGLIGLTAVWCQELGEYNITVNAVCPGFVESAMWTDHLSPAISSSLGVKPHEVIETVAQASMALKRPQTPEDIGDAVAYIAKADNVSGEALVVDGGHCMS